MALQWQAQLLKLCGTSLDQEIAVRPEDRPSLPRSGHCMVALPPEHPDDVLLFGGCAARLSRVPRLSIGAPGALDWHSRCPDALAWAAYLWRGTLC